MRHLYRKKVDIVIPMAGVLAAFGIFGACMTNAWAAPSAGESVADNIVVRDSAVTGAQVGSLVEGQAVTITGETTGSDGKKWYSVTFEANGNERDGWVRADLIDTTGTASQDEDEDEDETEDADEDADVTEDADEDADATEDTDEDADAADSDAETADEDAETAEIVAGTVRMELANGYVELTDVPDEVAAGVSNRFVESECVLADGTVLGYQLATADALVSNDAILTNYYYLYGTNDIGESGWYVYDASQGSLQKSILEMSYSLTDTGETDEAEQESDTDDLVRMMVAVLALVCVLLLILAIVFSARYRRLRNMLEREERLEERRAAKERTKKQEKREDDQEPERNIPYKQVREPVEIMDLDDMDDADYEELLDQYQEEHMPSGEVASVNTDDLPEDAAEKQEDMDGLPPLEENAESAEPEMPVPKSDDDGNDDDDDDDGEDDDLEFL